MYIYCKLKADMPKLEAHPLSKSALLLQICYEEILLVWKVDPHQLQQYTGRGCDQELCRFTVWTAVPLNVWGLPQSPSRVIIGSEPPSDRFTSTRS